jgi:hypothetical protein
MGGARVVALVVFASDMTSDKAAGFSPTPEVVRRYAKAARASPMLRIVVREMDSGRIKRLSAGLSALQLLADVRFAAHCGLKSDIAPCPNTCTTGDIREMKEAAN